MYLHLYIIIIEIGTAPCLELSEQTCPSPDACYHSYVTRKLVEASMQERVSHADKGPRLYWGGGLPQSGPIHVANSRPYIAVKIAGVMDLVCCSCISTAGQRDWQGFKILDDTYGQAPFR